MSAPGAIADHLQSGGYSLSQDVLRLLIRSHEFARHPFNEESYSSPYRIGDGIRNTGLAARDNCLDRLQCTPQGYESEEECGDVFLRRVGPPAQRGQYRVREDVLEFVPHFNSNGWEIVPRGYGEGGQPDHACPKQRPHEKGSHSRRDSGLKRQSNMGRRGRRSDSPFGFLTFAASRNNQVSDSYNRIRTIRHQVIGSSGKCGLRWINSAEIDILLGYL